MKIYESSSSFANCAHNCDEIECKINCYKAECIDKCALTDCFYSNIKHTVSFICYIVVICFQGISLIMLFASFITMFRNLSDEAIRVAKTEKYNYYDYFRPPQVNLFIIAICGIILSTFAESAISATMLPKCKASDKKYKEIHNELKQYNFSDYNDNYTYKCNQTNKCEEIKKTFSAKNCSDLNNCTYEYFDYYGKCDYIFNYVYFCSKNGSYDCSKYIKCDNINRLDHQNVHNDLDEVRKDGLDFYYTGYCQNTPNKIYYCTKKNDFWDMNNYDHLNKCYEIANCSEWNQIKNSKVNYCYYWDNCSFFEGDFYYLGNCGLYNESIYKCQRNVNMVDKTCNQNKDFFLVIIVFGGLQLIIVIILFILEIKLRGELFKNILEIPISRYSIHLIPSIVYPILIAVEIISFVKFQRNHKNLAQPKYKNESAFTLLFCIFQFISFCSFVSGLIFVKINKSDKEIIEKNSEISQQLLPSNINE